MPSLLNSVLFFHINTIQMVHLKKSIGAIALVLTIGATFAANAFAQDDRPCSTSEGGQGTVGTVSSLNCGGNDPETCCYLIPSDEQIRRP